MKVLGVSKVKMTGNRVKKTGDAAYIPHACVCVYLGV